MSDDLTDEGIEAIQEAVVEVCATLQEAGVACVIVTAGRGCDRVAYLDATSPFAATMLAHAMKAVGARNVRLAN